jgi:DNA-directed RNA polymerase I subunit RPA1
MNSWSCPGHPGHIELPVHVYNVTFFDQMYRLLRAQCVYCHRLQIARVQVNAYVCKLRLLQYGLVDEVAEIDAMALKKDKKSGKDGEESGSEDEDPDDLMERRSAFVKRCIRKAQAQGKIQSLLKDPVAAEFRRALVKEFFKDIGGMKKCTSCSG